MAATAREMRPTPDPARPRAILRMNALAAVAIGSLMLLLAGPVNQLLGLGGRGPLAIAGLVLLAIGSDELFVAVRRGLRRLHLRLFALTDFALVAAGVAFLAAGPAALTILDRAIVVLATAVLGLFAVAAFRAARSLS